MSRRDLINDLVANGYEPGVLAELNLGELCILTQEEFIENTWSPEARAAAMASRHKRQGISDANKRKELASKTKAFREKVRTFYIPTSTKTGAKWKGNRQAARRDMRDYHRRMKASSILNK